MVAHDVLTEMGLDPDAHPGVARVTFFAGMAHRALGDNFCNVVYDGGPLLDYTEAYPRAISHFEDAIMRANKRIAAVQEDTSMTAGQINSAINAMEEIITASHGAMAQTYLIMASEGMGEEYWDLAKEYAGRVPTDFSFAFNMVSGDRNSNRISAWTRSRRETTMWRTPFAEWGLNVDKPLEGGDPRVPYETPMENGDHERAHDNRRPVFMQRKFTGVGNNLPLVKGTEMRLIEAEVELVKNQDFDTLIEKINEIRQYHNENAPAWWRDALGPDPLPLLDPVDNLEDAWITLIKERGIELYLEIRRVADLRRWQTTPGREFVSRDVFRVTRRDSGLADPETDPIVWVYERERGEEEIPPHEMCLQVSRDEKMSNPNIR